MACTTFRYSGRPTFISSTAKTIEGASPCLTLGIKATSTLGDHFSGGRKTQLGGGVKKQEGWSVVMQKQEKENKKENKEKHILYISF